MAGKARGARRRGSGGEALGLATPRSPSAPTSSCSATSPAQLEEVAERDRRRAKARRLDPRPACRSPSSRWPTRTARSTASCRTSRSRSAEGVLCYAPGSRAAEGPRRRSSSCSGAPGRSSRCAEPLIEPAMALMSCGPAFFALVVEALVDAGVRHGLDAGRGRARWSSRRWPAPPPSCARRRRHRARCAAASPRPGGSTGAASRRSRSAGLRAAFDGRRGRGRGGRRSDDRCWRDHRDDVADYVYDAAHRLHRPDLRRGS